MGGGHHHHEPFVVPDYKKYDNWRQYAKLVEHQERLAAHGLKPDPWIRNYVHLFNPRHLHAVMGKNMRIWPAVRQTAFAGFEYGLAAAAIAVVLTETYSFVRYGYTSFNKPKHH